MPKTAWQQFTQASALSPPHALDRKRQLFAIGAHAAHNKREIEVALRSSCTRTTVPSAMSRTIDSSASEWAFHASQSLLHNTPLTTFSLTALPNSDRSARRTRRLLVPER
jgi:hypothetical protein